MWLLQVSGCYILPDVHDRLTRSFRDFNFSPWYGCGCSARHDVHAAFDTAHDLSPLLRMLFAEVSAWAEWVCQYYSGSLSAFNDGHTEHAITVVDQV
jgi:hypothetical protein